MENIIKMVMALASKSNVDKRKVGCVILGKRGEIYGTGYNSADYTQTPPTHLHAEMMAMDEISPTLMQHVAEGLCQPTVYVSHTPCKECAKELLDNGLTNIVVVEAFMKFDTDKLRYDLVPPKSIELLAEVLTFGAKKYKPNNWRENKDLARYEGALLRHIQAWRLGEKLDPETKLPHLAHALTNLVFLLELDDDNR